MLVNLSTPQKLEITFNQEIPITVMGENGDGNFVVDEATWELTGNIGHLSSNKGDSVIFTAGNKQAQGRLNVKLGEMNSQVEINVIDPVEKTEKLLRALNENSEHVLTLQEELFDEALEALMDTALEDGVFSQSYLIIHDFNDLINNEDQECVESVLNEFENLYESLPEQKKLIWIWS